jgi:hypothetical protein
MLGTTRTRALAGRERKGVLGCAGSALVIMVMIFQHYKPVPHHHLTFSPLFSHENHEQIMKCVTIHKSPPLQDYNYKDGSL